MRIAVEKIPDPGQDVRVDRSHRWAADAASTALDTEATAEGQLTLQREKADVDVTGQLRVTGSRPCERCGEDVAIDLPVEVELTYVPYKPADEDEVELGDDELDVGFYQDGEIDLATVISEAVALALPPRIACADVEACDARTAALLAEKGRSGEPGQGAFAGLKVPGNGLAPGKRSR